MALLTLHRLPSISTTPDESLPRRGVLQKRQSFALVKGAVLLLEEGERVGLDEETSSTPPSPGKESDGASDARHRHLRAMVEQLRPEDTIKLAVQLESSSSVRVRYLIVVSTLDNKQESILLGMDFPNSDSDHCTVGLVLPVWSDTQVYLDGDGGFSVTTAEETRMFKPVSMQTMWSVLQVLHGCSERAVKAAVIPGNGLEWAQHYHLLIESDRFCLNEWEAMNDLESVRRDSDGQRSAERMSNERLIKEHLRDIMSTEDLDNLTSKMVHSALETRIGFDMKRFKEYIDNEILVTMAQMDNPSKIFDFLYLGSEWNAANFEELQKNNVGYILNVTREIDNFFPESFTYMNIRVYDVEATDLLPYWLTETFNFINTARKSGQAVLVHCKMGVSRSASTVIAYAMKQQRWSLDMALAYAKDCRSIVKPNEGFMRQLQTYDGILNASQQRHSALWRRKSRDHRQKSVRKEREDGKPEEEEEEEEEEEDDDDDDDDDDDEGLGDYELSDEDDLDSADEKEDIKENTEVFTQEPTPQSETNQGPGHTAPPAYTLTVTEPDKVASSVNRSGRMNLFSLMQSISDEDKGREQLPGSPRRSPGQRMCSQRRRALIHQRACEGASPEPRSLPDASKNKP